jgi:hypothetical protein
MAVPDPQKIFRIGTLELRVKLNEDGAPLFNATDACRGLGIQNVSQACAGLSDDEKVYVEHISTDNRQKRAIFLTEPGLFHLFWMSRKPEAEEFKRWEHPCETRVAKQAARSTRLGFASLVVRQKRHSMSRAGLAS